MGLEHGGQGTWPSAKGDQQLHLANGVHGALRRGAHGALLWGGNGVCVLVCWLAGEVEGQVRNIYV